MSAYDRLNYVTFPALFFNLLLLLFPVLIFLIIRGCLFAKHWRGRRMRNTLVLMMVAVFAIQVTPLPSLAAYDEPVITRFLGDKLKQRLALMYGGAENVGGQCDSSGRRIYMQAFANGEREFIPGMLRQQSIRRHLYAPSFTFDRPQSSQRRGIASATHEVCTHEPSV